MPLTRESPPTRRRNLVESTRASGRVLKKTEQTLNPFANLADDHRQITVALDAIDSLLILSAASEFELAPYSRAVDFIERWADGAHYEKEELLFAELAQVGVPRQMGPTAFLQLEHDATRGHARRMRDALVAIAGGRQADRAILFDAMARYVAILRVHMPKEDACYFPMGTELLPKEAKARLAPQFEAIDAALPATFEVAARGLTRGPPSSGDPVPTAQPYSDAAIERLGVSLEGLVPSPPGPCRGMGIVRRR